MPFSRPEHRPEGGGDDQEHNCNRQEEWQREDVTGCSGDAGDGFSSPSRSGIHGSSVPLPCIQMVIHCHFPRGGLSR